MLGSWLSVLTVTATVLLVPALAALHRVDRHAHKAPPRGLERRVGLVAAVTLVAVGALLVAALLGTGALGALLVAAVLGGSVVAAAPGRDGWAVRGIVTRGVLTTAAVAALLWIGYHVLSPSGSALGGPLLGSLWGLAAWGAVQLRRPVESRLAARAALDDAAPGMSPAGASAGAGEAGTSGEMTASSRRPVPRRTGVALAALVVPAAAYGLVAGGRAPEPEPPASRAGAESSPAPTEAPRTGPASVSPSASGSGAAAAPSRPSGRHTPSGTPTRHGTPEPHGEPSSTAPGPSEATTTAAPSASPSPSGGGLPTAIPVPTVWPEESKTPGYAKEKPNRPSGAPSPGSGKG